MSQITQKIDLLGRREAATLAASTTQRVFASLAAGAPSSRQAVSLSNCDGAAEIYVSLAPSGAGAPSVGTNDFDLLVPPRATRQIQIGASVEAWVRSSAASAVAYTALELL